MPFLTGLTFHLLGFPEQRQQELSDWITEAEGDLAYSDHQGKVDYLLVPMTGWDGDLMPHRHLVSDAWLESCLDYDNGTGHLLPVEFHHRPVRPIAGQPLEGVVACLSGYVGTEREFLAHLVGALGGLHQEVFAKRNKDKVKGSTHLICPEGDGSKYNAAMKWNLPVVSKDWLRACHRDQAWVSERNFLVGEAKTVTSGKPEPSEPEEETNMEVTEEDTVTNMSVDEVHRSYGPSKASPKTSRAPNPVQVNTPVTPLAALRVDSPATAVRVPVRPQVDSPSVEVLRPPAAARSTEVHTPGHPVVDSPMATQTLRPKPINLTDITVTPQRWADSQPSPSGESSSVKRRRNEDDVGSSRVSGMATPTTPYGSHFTPNPTPRTRKYFKTMAGAMPKPELTELERRQMEEFANFRPEGTSAQSKVGGEMEEDINKKAEEDEKSHQEALDLMQSRGLPVIERDSRPFEDIMEEHYQKQGKSWKTFSQDAAARARAKLEAMEGEMDQKEENKVLEGVTVCVARKLINQAEEVQKVVKELGGKVSHQIDENVTHLVFRGQQNDKTKEFRTAREAGISVIAPDWVFMCRDEGRKVEEELFPHTFNPRKKLDITGSSPPLALSQSQPRSSSSRKRKVDTKVIPPVSLAMSQISQMAEEDENDAGGEEDKNEEEPLVSKEVSGDLEAMASLLDSRSGTPISSNRKVLRTKLSNQEEKNRTPKAAKDIEEEEEVKREEEKMSQVMWVDPIEEEERRKLKERVNALETQDLNNMVTMDTMDTMDTMGMTAVGELEDEESNKENRARGNTFVFMVSALSDEQSKQMEEALSKLGGRVANNATGFDPLATHMITSKVARSEKILCTVASGRWFLHPSYITESLSQGRWLEEERFEWGNELNGFLKEQLKVAAKEGKENTEVKLAAAARHWRLRMLEGAGGEAFSGVKVNSQSN